jgi:hypothetical protein
MAQISLTTDIAIPNGPKLGFARKLDVEAFDKIDLDVAAGANNKEVQLQPGPAGQVQFLLVVADWYGPELSYKVNNAGGTARALDQPHMFTGGGAVSMVDAAALAKLFFSNTTNGAAAKDAKVQILIGRDATP